MKRYEYLLLGLLLCSLSDIAVSQRLISSSSVTGVCYAGKRINRIYVPPPNAFFSKGGSKGGAEITVLYSGFTAQARTAVDYAISILESILPAGTKFTVSASYERITNAGVLGNSSISGFAGGWTIDAFKPLALYPAALAEKIAGESLNDSLDSDISLRINSTVNWYMGTDGLTPGTKYDLVTVVLHELCHGIGFFDSMNADNSIGWFGSGSLPVIYDTFLENLAGIGLTDTLSIPNYSADLRNELTGSSVYFDAPLLSNFTSGSRARIYAPAVWDAGSSISHLDEDATIEPNTLMTPYIDLGEAIHDPGKLTMSILGDIGWINTRIIHKPPHDTEVNLDELALTITIASDTLYDRERIGAVISLDRFLSSDTVYMTPQGNSDTYSCAIMIPAYNTGVQYYFFAEDSFKRVFRSPSLTDSIKYSVYIGTDTIKPEVLHDPLPSLLEKIDTITFRASVSDNLGLDTVYVEYLLNNGPAKFLGMSHAEDDSYMCDLNAAALLLSGGDSLRYRIIASDSARVPNIASHPESGYHTIHFEDIGTVVESYSTDFSGEAINDFINNGFEILTASGFTRNGLNTKHPYSSPEEDDKTYDFTSILRHPLKFNESGLVFTFNEVVLVEPGEPGSIFGSEDFYDYVILEGSADYGKKWFYLADGYDSRLFKSWETTYNSIITGQDSRAVGKESMLQKHTLYLKPSEEISAGDTLLIRFRLFSDPYANGWGWVVEDLNIYPLVDNIRKDLRDINISLYPNPGQGIVRILLPDEEKGKTGSIHYSVMNASGIILKSDFLSDDSEPLIDISDYPSGLYIIVLSRDDWIKSIKYSLIR